MAFDVFISYRREGACTVARLIYQILENNKINSFFDSERLGVGDFGKLIGIHLKDAPNFIFIVSHGVFDRCQDENDWVRQEIELALSMNKNIIPVFVNGVTGFPENLPESISEISRRNAIELNHKDFDRNFNILKSWIRIERKELVINTTLGMLDPEDEVERGYILDMLADIVPNKELGIVAKQEIKKHWIGDVNQLVGDYRVDFLRKICQSLDIDARGARGHLIERLEKWARDSTYTSSFSKERKDIAWDIAEKALNALDKQELSDICDEVGSAADRRSSDDMRNDLLQLYLFDVDDSEGTKQIKYILNIVGSRNRLDRLKELAENTIGVKGTREEVIEALCKAFNMESN